jgi:hypothetical protein
VRGRKTTEGVGVEERLCSIEEVRTKVGVELAWACDGEKETCQKERWATGMEIGREERRARERLG